MPRPDGRLTRRIISASAAAAALMFACGDVIVDPPPPPPPPPGPAMVLENIGVAWNIRSLNLYQDQLAPAFVFYFNPDDVGTEVNGYVIPASWTYAETVAAVGNMLTQAYSISLNIATDKVGTPGPTDNMWRADNITLNLLLYVTPEQGYIVNAGYCNFEFGKYKGTDGKDYWRLTKWWDYTSAAGRGAAPSSLGRVLALYH